MLYMQGKIMLNNLYWEGNISSASQVFAAFSLLSVSKMFLSVKDHVLQALD